MAFRATALAIALGTAWAWTPLRAQESAKETPSTVSDEHPTNEVGVLIHGVEWTSIPSETPGKARVKHGLAPALTYGIASGAMVAEYQGAHAPVQIEAGRPVICICHFYSLPGDPVLVRLHPNKKNARELDGGKIHVGYKTVRAETADLVPVTISQPENRVWLVQPQQALAAGEYALMLGVQNMAIFPFSVAEARQSGAGPEKH